MENSADGRPGFQRLLAEVMLDHVGVIFGLEISVCEVVQGLGISSWNCAVGSTPRWLTPMLSMIRPITTIACCCVSTVIMSEAELHILKERMHQGKLNKARRGELLGPPPIGYLKRERAGH